MDGIIHISNFISYSDQIFTYLAAHADWDTSMALRKTASYGVAYNYSQISYPYKPMLPLLADICKQLQPHIGFIPNNCLLNYYADGRSKMGFHADNTDVLEAGTGVAIVSIGDNRVLRFRETHNKTNLIDYSLSPGSLLYMAQSVQANWQHAIPIADTDRARISLTFRRIAG